MGTNNEIQHHLEPTISWHSCAVLKEKQKASASALYVPAAVHRSLKNWNYFQHNSSKFGYTAALTFLEILLLLQHASLMQEVAEQKLWWRESYTRTTLSQISKYI